MGSLNLLDFLILTPLVFGLARGLYKGFVNELASLIALIGGILIAHAFADDVFVILSKYVEEAGAGIRILSYVLVFTAVVIIVFVLSRALTKMLGFLALGLVNRILGGLFGFSKMLIILLILTHFMHPFLYQGGYYEKPFFKESATFTYLLQYSDVVEDYFRLSIPDESPMDSIPGVSI
ncbi:MAG: CvpA family protein [Owenweeksia sp.]